MYFIRYSGDEKRVQMVFDLHQKESTYSQSICIPRFIKKPSGGRGNLNGIVKCQEWDWVHIWIQHSVLHENDGEAASVTRRHVFKEITDLKSIPNNCHNVEKLFEPLHWNALWTFTWNHPLWASSVKMSSYLYDDSIVNCHFAWNRRLAYFWSSIADTLHKAITFYPLCVIYGWWASILLHTVTFGSFQQFLISTSFYFIVCSDNGDVLSTHIRFIVII